MTALRQSAYLDRQTHARHPGVYGAGAVSAASSTFSAVSSGFHVCTLRSHSEPYAEGESMSCSNNNRKVWLVTPSPDGVKAIVADVLRSETEGRRNQAKEIANTLGMHENTALAYLTGKSNVTLWAAIKLGRRFKGLRDFIVDAITPSETSLAEDLENLRHLQARVEARLREELSHVRVHPEVAAEISLMEVGGVVPPRGTRLRRRPLSPGSGDAHRVSAHQQGD